MPGEQILIIPNTGELLSGGEPVWIVRLARPACEFDRFQSGGAA
jgi:hypothetical protein